MTNSLPSPQTTAKAAPAQKTTVKPTPLRFYVRTRGGRPLPGATVGLSVPDTKPLTTNGEGWAAISLALPDSQITVTVEMWHFGPDSLSFPMKPGPLTMTITVANSVMLASPGGPPVKTDSQGKKYLDCVLIDCGLAMAKEFSHIPTRRLEKSQVQQELMYHHAVGSVTLDADSEFVFKHENTAEFAPCGPGCTPVSPRPDDRVKMTTTTMGKVTWFSYLGHPGPDPATAPAKEGFPGERHLHDRFDWNHIGNLDRLDQRHVVGLVRLCANLFKDHQVVALYTQGLLGPLVNPNTGDFICDAHTWGLAVDVAGVGLALPENYDPETNRKGKGSRYQPVRMGKDYIIQIHWGEVGMWDSATVATRSPAALWERLPVGQDDGRDYFHANVSKNLLTYRLLPPPYPIPADRQSDANATRLASHYEAASTLFKYIYDFAAKEYSDTSDSLGVNDKNRDPTSVVGPVVSVFIVHPDYPTNGGRSTHYNHIHMQLGQTFYTEVRDSWGGEGATTELFTRK